MPVDSAPVLLLAYANDPVSPDRYLRHLVPEIHAIRDALYQRVVPPYRIEIADHVSLDDLIMQFDRHEGRIQAFHYAGHADSLSLMLEEEGKTELAGIEGFARLLGEQHGLQLVFLNGCATEAHAKAIIEAGVPTVVATSTEISDRAAAIFSERFYQRLGDGKTVEKAFKHAEIKTQTALVRSGEMRSLYFEKNKKKTYNSFPWRIYGDGRQWKLQLRKKSKQQGVLVPLLCDRDRQVELFRDKLENIYTDSPHLPQFYVIHGREMERHKSLVQRFREIDIRHHSERLFGQELGYVRFYSVKDWPNTEDLGLRRRNLLRAISYELELEELAGSNWRAEDLVAALRGHRDGGTIIFQHTIFGEKWNSNSIKLMEWYVQEFWNLEPKKERPLFVIFFNLIYPPESPTLLGRLFGLTSHKQRIQQELYALEEKIGERMTVLRELKPIPRTDVAEWVEEYYPDELSALPDVLYGSSSKRRLPMDIVERRLKEEVRFLQQQRARRELFGE
ncbi:MAG: CHAT domain-containing protein [Bacteroidota bacterium]